MRIHVENIMFEFDPFCSGCKQMDEDFPEIPVRTTLPDMIEAGFPICQHCGDSLELLDYCEVNN